VLSYGTSYPSLAKKVEKYEYTILDKQLALENFVSKIAEERKTSIPQALRQLN
jgi:hypothetical protein